MRRRALGLAAALALGLATPATADTPLRATQALLARLAAGGRAEARVETTTLDLLTGRTRVVHGRLALERPYFARLELPEGECLTLREDGGDWLVPHTRQLLRSGRRSAEAGLRWSALLLESGTSRFRERVLGGRGYELTAVAADSAGAERQRVWLAASGLPARLEIVSAAGEPRTYTLSGWRFTRARGRAAFVLSAPPGFETVDLP